MKGLIVLIVLALCIGAFWLLVRGAVAVYDDRLRKRKEAAAQLKEEQAATLRGIAREVEAMLYPKMERQLWGDIERLNLPGIRENLKDLNDRDKYRIDSLRKLRGEVAEIHKALQPYT